MNRKVIKVTLTDAARQYLFEEARNKRVSLNEAISMTFDEIDTEYYVMRRKHKGSAKTWSYLWTARTAEMYEWAKQLADNRKLSGLLEGLLMRKHRADYLGIVDVGDGEQNE